MPLKYRKNENILFSFSSKSKVLFCFNKVLLFVNVSYGKVNLYYVNLEAIKCFLGLNVGG